MSVNVRIPTTMRPIAGGASSVQVEGVTLSDVLANLDGVDTKVPDGETVSIIPAVAGG
jgi:molybdopterin converting factor small subunit